MKTPPKLGGQNLTLVLKIYIKLWYCPIKGVKNCKLCMYFDKMYVRCNNLCVIYSKIEFTINITHITGIHIFLF